MRKVFASTPLPGALVVLPVGALGAILAAGLLVAPRAASAAEPAKPVAAASPSGLRGDVVLELKDAEEKLTALAEETPVEKFGWRPAEGVRSVGEVFEHVAGSNYFIAGIWGAKPPAGVDPQGLEKRGADKAQVISDLKASFAFMYQQIGALTDKDLERATSSRRFSTVRGVVLLAAVHAHEHLGQAIAYARSNGIVPPWSQPSPKPAKSGS